jgi:hypothetical protein
MIPLLVGGIVLALLAIFLHSRKRKDIREKATDVLRVVAERLSIKTPVTGPALAFDRNGFPALLSIHDAARLNVEISFRLSGEEAGWLTVSSLGFRRAILDQLGLKDIQVGEHEFDDALEIWGNDEGLVRDKLNPDARGILMQADKRWDFFLRLTPEALTIRARMVPFDRYQVESIAAMGFQLLDILDLKSPVAVVISKVQERLDQDTRCPVCGTPLSHGKVVRCLKCRSAHHVECWKFNGMCATFACGSPLHE